MTLLNIQPNKQGQHQLVARTSPGSITEHRLRRIPSKGASGSTPGCRQERSRADAQAGRGNSGREGCMAWGLGCLTQIPALHGEAL